MKPELHIVKIGGRLLDEPEQQEDCLHALAQLPGRRILIHGGGSQASELASRLGVEVHMIEGRRVTDHATLEIALMVFAGLLNTRLVAELQAQGVSSIGLSGADGDLIRSRKRPSSPVDFGWVGDVERVRVEFLCQLLDLGLCPVICALSHDGQGQLLNTNADTVASEVAIAMSGTHSVRLWYSFDKAGVLEDPADPTTVITQMDKNRFRQLKESGSIASGMIPKLHTGFRALEQGAASVCIGQAGYFARPGSSQTQLLL